jgi:hypothetical protein
MFRVLVITPAASDHALLLVVSRFGCFSRRLAFRTEHSDFLYYGATALFGVNLLIIEASRSH